MRSIKVILRFIKMIAQDTNAQYIIGGAITDLSATVKQNLLKDDTINRQFALEMQIYDAKQAKRCTTNLIEK